MNISWLHWNLKVSLPLLKKLCFFLSWFPCSNFQMYFPKFLLLNWVLYPLSPSNSGNAPGYGWARKHVVLSHLNCVWESQPLKDYGGNLKGVPQQHTWKTCIKEKKCILKCKGENEKKEENPWGSKTRSWNPKLRRYLPISQPRNKVPVALWGQKTRSQLCKSQEWDWRKLCTSGTLKGTHSVKE